MATPPLSEPVPKVVAPSLKVTVPVAADGDTLAVNVTLLPNEGLVEDAASDATLEGIPELTEPSEVETLIVLTTPVIYGGGTQSTPVLAQDP